MSDYSEYVDQRVTSTIHLATSLESRQEADLRAGLENEPMVRVLTVEGHDVTLEHNPAMSDEVVLRAKIKKLGFEVVRESRSPEKQGIVGRWIQKLSEQNKKSLGSGRLDCCDLNKDI